MPERPANPAEFRRYRQALLVAYVVLGGLAILLVAASVIVDLFFSGKEAKLTEPTAVDALRCNRDVGERLEALGAMAARLQLEAVKSDVGDLGARWQRFAERWEAEWRAVGARCAFDDRAQSARGPAFERMAEVHRKLFDLGRKYREMMARFDEEQAREIARMREALDRSRADLQRQIGAPASGTSPP